MAATWLLPEKLHARLRASAALAPLFEGVDFACFSAMMATTIQHLAARRPFPREFLRRVERTHAAMAVTKAQFDEYVRLFLESAVEVGEGPDTVDHFARALDELQTQFIFDGDSKREEVMKRIRSIQADICDLRCSPELSEADLEEFAGVGADLDRIERDLMRGRAPPRARSSRAFLGGAFRKSSSKTRLRPSQDEPEGSGVGLGSEL